MTDPLPPEWDGWLREGARLAAVPPLRRSAQLTKGSDDPKFAFGDFLLTVPAEYLDRLAVDLRLEPSQIRIYREVAELVPPTRRVAASWTVHRDLRDRPELLRDGLTVRAAAQLAGKQPIDSKSDRRLSVSDKAAKVRAFLSDKAVYDLIETEMVQSRHDRRARRQATIVHGELARQQKDLEVELRAVREAKSPYEATVEAELSLNKAAQLVHAVGETLADLPQPERLTNVLRELAEQVREVLTRHSETDSFDNGMVVEVDTWRDRSARAALPDSNQRISSADERVVDHEG